MGRYGGEYSEPINPWIAILLASYGVAYFLLSFSVEWPEACDIPTGARRALSGLVAQFACVELVKGGLAEKLLFSLLWSFPALLVALGIGYRLKKARRPAGESDERE